jgi:hypothetical protein
MLLVLYTIDFPKISPMAYLFLHPSWASFPVNKEDFQNRQQVFLLVFDANFWVTAYSSKSIHKALLYYGKAAHAFQIEESCPILILRREGYNHIFVLVTPKCTQATISTPFISSSYARLDSGSETINYVL